jgi:hypothetical protein
MNLLTAPRDLVRRHLPRSASHWRHLVRCVAVLLMLCACQTELYGQPTERHSNTTTVNQK